MKTLILLIAISFIAIFSSNASHALPKCPDDPQAIYHDCYAKVFFDGGDSYEGTFKNNIKDGHGTYRYSNGIQYVGAYKDGQPNGFGTYTWPNGDKHAGVYKNGRKHGEGTETLASGHVYVGNFKNDKRHGKAVLTEPDGRKYSCIFSNGKETRCDEIKKIATKKVARYQNTTPQKNSYVSTKSTTVSSSSNQKKITIKGINIDMSLSEVADILGDKGFRHHPCPYSDQPCRIFRRNNEENLIRWEKNRRGFTEIIFYDCALINACSYEPKEVMRFLSKKGLIKSFEQVCNNELCYEGIGKAEDIIQVTKTLNAFGPPKCKDLSVIAKLMTRECTSWLIVLTNSTSGREKIKLD